MTALGSILNVSFYRFVTLKGDLEALRDLVKARAKDAGLKGSILLSEEGINGFLAAEETKLRPYLAWLFSEFPEFKGIKPKESFSATVPFSRMIVKVKKEIIAMGRPEVRPGEKTGKNIAPATLKSWYDEKKDFVILDTRNDYEIAQGTFKNAVQYDIGTFKEFPEALEKNAEALKDKTVVMFCTGGIRCEKATALAMDLGISDVYQLEGGILKYFEEEGSAHYRGDCFVFDGRENVDAGLEAREDKTLRLKSEGLRLIYGTTCPFSQRVLYAMRAKGLKFEEVPVDLKNLPEEVKTLNPHGAVPILQNRDLTLYESGIILSYLDENFPELDCFTPDSAERRSRMRLWMDWADRLFVPSVKMWTRNRSTMKPEDLRTLEIKLEKDLYRLKTPLQRSRRFLVVDSPTQADFAAYTILSQLRSHGFPTEFPERFELVWNWYDRMTAVSHSVAKEEPKSKSQPA